MKFLPDDVLVRFGTRYEATRTGIRTQGGRLILYHQVDTDMDLLLATPGVLETTQKLHENGLIHSDLEGSK